MKTHTKITYSIMGVTAGAALLFATGCGKQEQPAGATTKPMSPAASETPKPTEAPKPAAELAQPAAAASQAASSAATEAQKTADAAKTTTEQALPAVTAAAQEAVSAATNQAGAAVAAADSQVGTLIRKAKGLMTDEKYQDALTVIQQLSSLKLTPEQRTLVDSLKAQIQTALAKAAGSDPASALGNVLGGKK